MYVSSTYIYCISTYTYRYIYRRKSARNQRDPTRKMAIEDEEPYSDCVVCFGERLREQRSEGSAICKHDSCKREYARRRAGLGTDEAERTALAPPAKAARTSCFKIREVLGVDMCVAASPRQQRAGRKADDDNIAYKVRGGFGEDKDDELIPETRWIRLSELVHNMDERSLIALDKWAGKLQKALQEARQRKRAQQEAAGESD